MVCHCCKTLLQPLTCLKLIQSGFLQKHYKVNFAAKIREIEGYVLHCKIHTISSVFPNVLAPTASSLYLCRIQWSFLHSYRHPLLLQGLLLKVYAWYCAVQMPMPHCHDTLTGKSSFTAHMSWKHKLYNITYKLYIIIYKSISVLMLISHLLSVDVNNTELKWCNK